MTRDEIIKLANAAGLVYATDADEIINFGEEVWLNGQKGIQVLEDFFVLASEAEREECAKVCEPQSAHDDPLTAFKIAEAIRAREQQ